MQEEQSWEKFQNLLEKYKELGNSEYKKKNYLKALEYYENGIFEFEIQQEIENRLDQPGNSLGKLLISSEIDNQNVPQSQKQEVQTGFFNKIKNFITKKNDHQPSQKTNLNQPINQKIINKEIFSIYTSLLSNKALCELNLQCYDNALESTNLVLKLDSTNLKAKYRRAQALKELAVQGLKTFQIQQQNISTQQEKLEKTISQVIQHLKKAEKDYETVIKHEPNNNTVIADLVFIKKNLPKIKQQQHRLISRSVILKEESQQQESSISEWNQQYLNILFSPNQEDLTLSISSCDDICPFCSNQKSQQQQQNDLDKIDSFIKQDSNLHLIKTTSLLNLNLDKKQISKDSFPYSEKELEEKKDLQQLEEEKQEVIKEEEEEQQQQQQQQVKKSKKSKKSSKNLKKEHASDKDQEQLENKENLTPKQSQEVKKNDEENQDKQIKDKKDSQSETRLHHSRSVDVNEKGGSLKGYFTDLRYMKSSYNLEESLQTYPSVLQATKLRNQLHHQYKITGNNTKGKTASSYSKNNKRKMSQVPTKQAKVSAPYLPERTDSTKPYTLVLDLDKTLIFSERLDIVKNNDRYVTHLRPNLYTFLDNIKHHFELVIFTAAEQDYADKIIDYFDPEHRYFEKTHILYKQHMKFKTNTDKDTGEQFKEQFKDLNKIGRDLNKTLIIDDLEQNFSLQKRNGIKIPPFEGATDDNALMLLIPVLQFFAKQNLTIQEASEIRLFNPIFYHD